MKVQFVLSHLSEFSESFFWGDFFFWMWIRVHFLKVFIEFVTVLVLLFFMFCFSGCETCRILALRPGLEPAPPPFKGKVLTTSLPRKSLKHFVCMQTSSRHKYFHFLFNLNCSFTFCRESHSRTKKILQFFLIIYTVYSLPPPRQWQRTPHEKFYTKIVLEHQKDSRFYNLGQ